MANISTIHFIKREELDILRYNKLVEATEGVNIYCFSWYLDIVAENWGCMVKGDYEAVLPIPYTVKFKQEIIYQPFFTRELNTFLIKNGKNFNSNEMFKAIPSNFKKIDFAYTNQIELESFEKKEALYQSLNLESDYTSIRASYSKNTKRLLNKSLKSGVEVESSYDVKAFISFFKKNTGDQVNYTAKDYIRLEKLISYLLNYKKGSLIIAKKGDTVLAQGVFIQQNHRTTYLKGSVNSFGKELGAMFLLMDYMIKSSIEKDKECFDFGGSNIEAIATFYKKFGAENHIYYRYSKNDLSWILKKGKMIRDSLKK